MFANSVRCCCLDHYLLRALSPPWCSLTDQACAILQELRDLRVRPEAWQLMPFIGLQWPSQGPWGRQPQSNPFPGSQQHFQNNQDHPQDRETHPQDSQELPQDDKSHVPHHQNQARTIRTSSSNKRATPRVTNIIPGHSRNTPRTARNTSMNSQAIPRSF